MNVNKINGHELKMYEGIDDLPMDRYSAFNRYLLIEGGVGSDMSSVNTHLSRVEQYIANDDKKSAMLEIGCLRQNMAMVLNDVNLQSMSFAVLIHSIDGVKCTDLGDEGLRELLKKINPSQGRVHKIVSAFKKKLILRLLPFTRSTQTKRMKQYIGNS